MNIGYLMQAGVPELRQQPLSGPALHVFQVIHKLKELGHRVKLLAQYDSDLWISEDLKRFDRVTVPLMDRGVFHLFERGIRRVQSQFRLPYAAFFDSLRFAQACRNTLKGSDVFYERMGWMGYGGGLAARWLGIPLVLEVNGDHLSEFEMLGIAPKGLQRWLSIKLMQRSVAMAVQFVATGEGWRSRFLERWNVCPDLVTVIENGSVFVDMLERGSLQCFKPVENVTKPVTIIYVGAFEPWHGIPILLEATEKLKARGLYFHLMLVGSGNELDKIEQMIKAFELEGFVSLLGNLTTDQLVEYLMQAEIGVSPYCGRAEFSGLKLLDYKAAGLATIASGKDGQPAVLNHGRTGWIVPPCDVDSLEQAIAYLIKQPDLRKRIGREARFEAEEKHSWRHTVGELEAIFVNCTRC